MRISDWSSDVCSSDLRAPIILTSPGELPGFGNPQPRDVGGIVLAGNAPANCNPSCVAEWDPTLHYGGDNANDSSGVLRYVQVRYRSEEHTSELQSLMRISYAVFCLKKNTQLKYNYTVVPLNSTFTHNSVVYMN